MKQAPSWFRQELERDFLGQLRIRWSVKDSQWLIEQKVGRAHMPTIEINDWDDSKIRARDGYAYVLSVSDGDRMACPKCRSTLHLPIREFKETVCNCKARVRACFWPLNDSLLEHLRKIDPYRGGNRRVVATADAYNTNRARSQDRALSNTIQAGLREDLSKMGGFNPIGYTGKVFTG